ncbi:helix-turn-helix domain-containing protein [Roseomonas sp. SSH11]|uniref:Helix-turn-helix domain-containing protein n=1 Tax=Pararoseomonas baculiformis TaxID=2820812 RepID=A0ABS4A9I1_9PROT|nr:helix-turn-helix domain-containing protein [Pararoseomonas baculiformis]MBP0443661.1 helix-turn-helix domain-containing protein [Pararoseomonas baculiformis]
MQLAATARSASPANVLPFPIPGFGRAQAMLNPLVGRTLHFQRGAEIYPAGKAADQLYQVFSGTVRTCRLLPDGRRMIAQFALAGELFGLDGVGRHRFFAEAVTDAVVIAFSRRDIAAWVDRDPAAAQSWHSYTLEKLAAAQDRFILLGRRTAAERVAAFLLDLADRGKGPDGVIELPMSRYDIADFLGLTAETVSRVLTTLRKNRLVANHGTHHLRILNRDALEEQADEEAA